MNTRNRFETRFVAILTVILLCPIRAAFAAASNTTAHPSSATNAVLPAIPKSVFVVPKTPKEGCDPFFPNSVRVYASNLPKTNRVSGPISLELKGLSGTPERRLAIINDYTFAEGETNEVNTPTGRVRVHCLQIKDDSVIVEVAGERRELRLRQD